jgi:hypothetical protein
LGHRIRVRSERCGSQCLTTDPDGILAGLVWAEAVTVERDLSDHCLPRNALATQVTRKRGETLGPPGRPVPSPRVERGTYCL